MQDTASTTDQRLYLGKYRGTVVNNIDPQQIGRLQVNVADVPLALSSWAMPCFPFAGQDAGAWMIPIIGTGVWVEFEQGDPDFPIWTGCFYGSALSVPTEAKAGVPASPNVVLKTTAKHAFSISDLPGPAGGFKLQTLTGALIAVNDAGITISNGKGATIQLTGPTVTINNGALTVT